MTTDPGISSDEVILVEYLDGELTLKERRDVEERLANDPAFREHLARLEASWKCLDLLDRETTDKELVETTLETVVFNMEGSLEKLEKRNDRSRFWKNIRFAFLAALVLFIAFHIGMSQGPVDHFLVGISLPIIERLDMYLLVLDNDPDFLRLLTERRVFLPSLPKNVTPTDPKYYQPSNSVRILDTFSIRPTFGEMKRRVQKIESLDETLYNQYYWNNKRFLEFSWEKKHKLKNLHESIESSPGRGDLFRTLQNYYNWQKSLQSYEQLELNSKLPVGEQIDRIVGLKNRLDSAQTPTYAAPIISDILKSEEGIGVHDLAEKLKSLDRRQFERVLNSPPDQAISILSRLYAEGD